MDLINSNSKLIPLEREYEAWIIANIETYFETLGINYLIRALSSKEEKLFPADELLHFPGSFKLFGLQMKQPKFSGKNKQRQWTDLKWSLSSPPHQYSKILSIPSIYYCLPAFTNREFRKQALSHCYFWRPKNDESRTYYLKGGDNNIIGAMKWPEFIQDILNCKIGTPHSDFESLSRILKIEDLLSKNDSKNIMTSTPSLEEEDSALYIIGIEIK